MDIIYGNRDLTMHKTIKNLIEKCDSEDAVIWRKALVHSAYLIERHSMERYGDQNYHDMPDDLSNHILTEDEYQELVNTLIGVLKIENDGEKVATAAWALGKSFSDRVVPHLIHLLKECWKTDGDIAYQTLIALDNHGIEQVKDIVADIAKYGKGKSHEFALQLKELESW